MLVHVAPPLHEVPADDRERVRAALAEARARVEVARGATPALFGGMPTLGTSRLSVRSGLAFMVLLPIAMVWVAFSVDVVALTLAAVTLACGICAWATIAPACARAQRRRTESGIVPCAVVAAHPGTRDPTTDALQPCYGVVPFDPDLEAEPLRLAAIADRMRTALGAADAPRDPEAARFVAEVAPRVAAFETGAPRRAVPPVWTGGADVAFVELALASRLLPGEVLDRGLILVLVHPTDPAAHLQGTPEAGLLWGAPAIDLTARFPAVEVPA